MASNNLRDRMQRKNEREDQNLRLVILECMANAEIQGDVLIANMEAVFKWIKTGRLPGPPKLKIVKEANDAS